MVTPQRFNEFSFKEMELIKKVYQDCMAEQYQKIGDPRRLISRY